MAAAHFRICTTDEDLAEYALFFIRNRSDFSRDFTLIDTLMHILATAGNAYIHLILDDNETTIGWVSYRYLNERGQEQQGGEIAFIDSVIMLKTYRSSRTFLRGFRYLANHMAQENSHVRKFQFNALADHAYLTRLYSKFAVIIGERDGYHGKENIFSADFPELLLYLNRSK